MLLAALVPLALAEPPTVKVGFTPDAPRAAVILTWTEGGSGFVNARGFTFDLATGAVLAEERVRLTEGNAARGVAGAEADLLAGAAFSGLDFAATPVPCADGRCGALAVAVTSTPTPQSREACGAFAGPDLVRVTMGDRVVVDESVPATRCPSAWSADRAWFVGDRGVLLLAYRVPGHEGYEVGYAPLPVR